MPEQEWYTLQDLVSLLNIPYSKVRGAVFFLRNNGSITVRDNPQDARILEVHKNSVQAIKAATGAS